MDLKVNSSSTPNTELDARDEELLDLLRASKNFDEQIEAVSSVVKAKRAAKLADTAPFREMVSSLGERAKSGDDRSRLVAVASLELLRVITKRKSGPVGATLKDSLASPLPSPAALGDGDQRYYVASAIEHVRPAWSVDFAAREAMAETTAETARAKLVEALLACSASVEAVLGALAAHVSAIRATEKQADTNGRTARRVLDSLRQAVTNHTPIPGDHVGEALRDFVVAAFTAKGPPDDSKVMNEVTEAVAQMIVALVRTRFSLMMDRTLYAALSTCKRSYLASSWTAFVERSRGIAEVRRVILDAARLSARLGIRDQGLLDSLDIVRGTRERSLQDLREIAREVSGLTPDVQHWLNTGRAEGEARTDAASEAMQVLEADRNLAQAMLEAAEVKGGDPAAGGRLAKAILDIGHRRSMVLFGEIGAIVPFSPSEHMLVQGQPESSTVRIVSRGVLRRDTAGKSHVLVKAIVSTK